MLQISSLLAACLLAVSWLVSIHFLPWMTWYSEATAFLAVCLLAWAGLFRVFRARPARTIALPQAVLPFIGLGLIAVIQRSAGLTPFWGDVWVFGFYMALCAACLVLGYAAASPSGQAGVVADSSEPFTLLASAILFGALASAVVAFAQVFSLWEHADWIVRTGELRRPGGNLAQPNHLATLLVMGLASLIYLHQCKKFGALAAGLMLLLLGAGIAVTESRAGALSVVVLWGWWLLKRRAIGDFRSGWTGVAAGIVVLGLFVAWPYLLNAMDLLSYRAEDRLLEGSLRLQVWPQLIKALWMHPWTGWGVYQVAAALNAVADAYPVSEPYTYSHNLILDLAIWVGIPLALLLVVATGLWLWGRVRAVEHALPWYGLAVALPLAVHSMLEYPYAYAYFLVPVMFLLGAVEASTGERPFIRVDVKPVAAGLLIASVVLACSMVEYLEIEDDFRVAQFEAMRIGSVPSEHRPPKIILLDQLATLVDDVRTTPTSNMSPAEMLVFKNAALRYPWPVTQSRYVVALTLNGDVAEAERQLKVMRSTQGGKVYARLKKQFAELAITRYPALNQLDLP